MAAKQAYKNYKQNQQRNTGIQIVFFQNKPDGRTGDPDYWRGDKQNYTGLYNCLPFKGYYTLYNSAACADKIRNAFKCTMVGYTMAMPVQVKYTAKHHKPY
jgi:hypothetical protein